MAMTQPFLIRSNTLWVKYSDDVYSVIGQSTGLQIWPVHAESNRARKEVKGIADLTLYVKDTTNKMQCYYVKVNHYMTITRSVGRASSNDDKFCLRRRSTPNLWNFSVASNN